MAPSRRVALAFCGCLAACDGRPAAPADGGANAAASAAVASSAAPSTSAADAPVPAVPPPPREGGALVRSWTGDALYVADEDHAVVRRVALPLDDGPALELPMPGRPAQVLAVGASLLVTIRDPSLLLVLGPPADGKAGLVETARVALPGDAWGIAVSPDLKTAVVTSAWTHRVSVVDLDARTVRFSVDVPREPRGVVVSADGKAAYVSHLVGAPITRVDLLAPDGAPAAADSGVAAPAPADPRVHRVELPAAPLRAPAETTLGASWGFALALSPDGRRLFAARHALGAPGEAAWFGAPAVDVLLTGNDKPLAPRRPGRVIAMTMLDEHVTDPWLDTPVAAIVQPRAMVYRRATGTLVVAGEGRHMLDELDALAIDPGAGTVFEQPLGSSDDPAEPAPTRGSAPAGVALSVDEGTAFVWCGASFDLVAVELPAPGSARAPVPAKDLRVRHLASDPLPALAARGRRVFHDASDPITSGGLACNGCHPEGRDDGHVWMEAQGPFTRAPIFVGGPAIVRTGLARQTPMLAGRVAAAGPYGWHAQNDDLEARILEGVHLHRWLNPPMSWEKLQTAATQRAAALAAFVRTGLVPPPRLARPLTPQEERGRELFSSHDTGCAGCHPPATEYTTRVAVALPQPHPGAPFAADPSDAFKTPSLLYVGGTPPYYHDGHAPTLAVLVSDNDDRMGRTRQLSEADRAALVAFLETL
jgi:cytochrome c peroxidase